MIEQVIDLRSDVVTRAPPAMLHQMSIAQIKPNQSLEDTLNLSFETEIATLFGKQAAIFFPTTSMANIACVIVHTKPGSEVIIWANSHSVERESSSFAILAGVQTRQIFSESGRFSAQEVKSRIRKSKEHLTFPDSDLIFIENGTFNGRVWPISQLQSIKQLAQDHHVKVHIDGARIFNALAHYKCQPKEISHCYDTMTICLTKGLCCPIGAVVVGDQPFIASLNNIRKGLGGGIWHTGILSTAGSYALHNLVPEIAKDNEMAKLLGKGLKEISEIKINCDEIEINMVHFSISEQSKVDKEELVRKLKEDNIVIKPFDYDTRSFRLVTHRSIREKQVAKIITAMANYFKQSNDVCSSQK